MAPGAATRKLNLAELERGEDRREHARVAEDRVRVAELGVVELFRQAQDAATGGG